MRDIGTILAYHIFVYPTESLGCLFVIHGILQQKIRPDRDVLLFMILTQGLFACQSIGMIPANFYVGGINYLFMFWYCWRKSRNWKKALQVMTASVMMTMIIELFLMTIFEGIHLFVPGWGKYIPIYFMYIGGVMTCVLGWLLYYRNRLMRLISGIFEKNALLSGVITVTGMVCIGGTVIFNMHNGFTKVEAFLFCVFSLLLLIALTQWEKAMELSTEKDRRIVLQQMCRESYEQLLLEVRNRQHEFQNHLAALQGMCYTSTSLEELAERQNHYFERLTTENKYNKLLYGTKNPLLSGFLYSKFSKADEQGINTEYTIKLENEIGDTFTLIELIGILYDNASEAATVQSEKKILVDIGQTKEQLCIIVENRSPYLTADQVSAFFQPGISTKGQRRGLGLAKLRRMVDAYDGSITTENIEKEDGNWFKVQVTLQNP